MIPMGPKGRVGVVLEWAMPSLFFWLIKSRIFFFEKAEGVITEADFVCEVLIC